MEGLPELFNCNIFELLFLDTFLTLCLCVNVNSLVNNKLDPHLVQLLYTIIILYYLLNLLFPSLCDYLLTYLVTWLIDGKSTAGSLDFIPCLIPPVFVDPHLEC